MSFTREKKALIQHYLMQKIGSHDPDFINKTADAFSMSQKTVYKYLSDLEKDGLLEKVGKNYFLKTDIYHFEINVENENETNDMLFFRESIDPILSDLPDNVRKIWAYCFSEMMNNVIEHSEAHTATVYLEKDYLNTMIIIIDDGVGIFRKIKDFFGYPTFEDAIVELFKGKLTTNTKNHSGEGIFFTSRICDMFGAVSDGMVFTHSDFADVLDCIDDLPAGQQPAAGTTIVMKLSNHSKKTLKEMFDAFSDLDSGLSKTTIPMKNMFDGFPVSRSQAKRLTGRFENFKEVVLDFDGVEDMGQGFAHQVFVVCQRDNPQVHINPVNMSESVARMYAHVRRDLAR